MATRPHSLLERIGVAVLLLLVLPIVIVLLIPFVVLGIPGRLLYGRWLRTRWEQTWGRQGKRILLVYSRSPHWQNYIETVWLPRVGPHAVVIDWSDRSTWRHSPPLEIRAFRYWGGDREFNPLAVLFPKRGKVRTVRFWRAFGDFKHGNETALRAAETELFSFVNEIGSPAAQHACGSDKVEV